jgi:hypothetical protein
MNLIVTLQLRNMPDATDPETVVEVLRRQAAEWLDFDRHPEDLSISVERIRPQPRKRLTPF